MSYVTRSEPITYWWITWYDGTHSKWPTKLWPVQMIDSLNTIVSYVKVNHLGIPIP